MSGTLDDFRSIQLFANYKGMVFQFNLERVKLIGVKYSRVKMNSGENWAIHNSE